MRIILSPHLDDAGLSCGASMARWTAAGDSVLLLNIFAGRPNLANLSEFARQLHQAAGAGEDLVTVRRLEDQRACAIMGADCRHMEYLDALYRTNPDDGGSLYPNNPELMSGSVHQSDHRIVTELSELLAEENDHRSPVFWYAPLGAGGHVDHVLVHMVAGRLEPKGAQVLYYEDYPYVEDGHALVSALARPGSTGWRSELSRVNQEDVERKCQGIACHQSQLAPLFGSGENMRRMVSKYAGRVGEPDGPAERFWTRCPSRQEHEWSIS
jgi:LmbE family N-acetylglucosaminyl deacetylase